MTTTVEKIVGLLVGVGYRRLPMPLELSGLKFELAAALVGTDATPDLIIIIDTVFEVEERAKRKIEGIARALDVLNSKRPLTAILVGPRPRTSTLDAASKVCRVLPIGTSEPGAEDAALANWLAVLMPLRLPQTVDAIADPISELLNRVEKDAPFAKSILAASPNGSGAVEQSLFSLINDALIYDDPEEDE